MQRLQSDDPARIGPYRLVASLGQGGMGRVFLGAAPDGRLVAVKQIHAELARDSDFRARFRQEVSVSRGVSGAYTAAVVGADPEADEPWLASVFVPGPSLRQVVDETGPLPEYAVLRLAAGLASALRDIHRARLIHRDLKPGNVLLTADGPRVIDFGIARALDGDMALTSTGSIVGSPAFMSPEQAEGRPLGSASDIFSFGALLVTAVAGHGPFSGDSTPQTLYNVVHAPPNLALVPPGIRQLAEPCLAKDPRQRPTAAQILSRLDASAAVPWPAPVHHLIARQQEQVQTALRWPAHTPVRSHAAGPRRRTAIRTMTVAGVLALAALTAILLWGRANEPAQPLTVQEAVTMDTLRRVNPCALLADATVPPAGRLRITVPEHAKPEDTNGCLARADGDLLIFIAEGAEVKVSTNTVKSDHGILIDPTPVSCSAAIPITDQPTLSLSAQTLTPSEKSCEVAKAVLLEAIARIRTSESR
ncbi:serine/threonine-protein kinase [Kibdelosporangium persicum]|uniref:Serine/threonine-protein kinase AfsK n=1 Tax=Kibdelosporangium persicum TaxID=2698649 RepID=A0ABX2FFC5_9PSEU|nr:serine/threonine-protein kinase [Kibdelosporangium persicum]NRN69435.1 Serine/threonine-protein kinase AfsK [Kibdelosporangium persicum]